MKTLNKITIRKGGNSINKEEPPQNTSQHEISDMIDRFFPDYGLSMNKILTLINWNTKKSTQGGTI